MYLAWVYSGDDRLVPDLGGFQPGGQDSWTHRIRTRAAECSGWSQMLGPGAEAGSSAQQVLRYV